MILLLLLLVVVVVVVVVAVAHSQVHIINTAYLFNYGIT